MKPELSDLRDDDKAYPPFKPVNCNDKASDAMLQTFGARSIQKVESELASWHVTRSCKNGFFKAGTPYHQGRELLKIWRH